jgi:hypothetical protein
MLFLLKCLYQARKVNGHVCVFSGIDLYLIQIFFLIQFWSSSDSAVFFIFILLE